MSNSTRNSDCAFLTMLLTLQNGIHRQDRGTNKTTIMRRLTSLMRTDARFRIAVIDMAEHLPSLFQLVKEILESFGVTRGISEEDTPQQKEPPANCRELFPIL